jgi:REP element-mobilizing transposase RayT
VKDDIHVRSRGYLPHWERDHATYFVTFGTVDSLPARVIEKMLSERDSTFRTASQAGRAISPSEQLHLDRLTALDRYLDSGHGECVLARPEIADVMTSVLQFFDGQRYELLAWCIMPNHIHVVMRVSPGCELAQILHSWKSFSAKNINAALGSTGEFWRREYYDHLVRNEADLDRVVEYVAQNPQMAGLANWPYVWTQHHPTEAGGTPAVR